MALLSVFASSSNNNEEDISIEDQPQESTSDEESSDNSNQSSDSQSEQNNSCSNELVDEPSFLNENGCPAPCPTLEDQFDEIPEGCPVPTRTTTDSQDNGQLQPNALSGNLGNLEQPLDNTAILPPVKGVQDLTRDGTFFVANGYLTFDARAVNFTPDYRKAINSISICVQTEGNTGNNTMESFLASPHCSIGGNTYVKYTVHPRQVTLSITASPKLIYDESPCLVTVGPNEAKYCKIDFGMNHETPDVKELPKFNLDLMKK